MSNKIMLSYSTMNAAINCPHTYLNRIMGLKTYSNKYMTAGKEAHRIIQAHMSGETPNPLLADLPNFPLVETEDFDPKMKVTMPINDKFAFHGYVDGINYETKSLCEIKTGGKKWSTSDFAKLVQWKLYMMALPEIEHVYLVNTPSEPTAWSSDTIRVFRGQLTENDRKDAENFIKKAVNIIDNIKDQNLYPERKSYWCYYIGCPYCPKENAEFQNNQ